MLGGYSKIQDIHPRYSIEYQKWYLTDIIVDDIQVAGYHPSWYSALWYSKIMLDTKTLIFDLDIRSRAGYHGLCLLSKFGY